VKISVRTRDDNNPLAGFGHGLDIYMLQIKTGSTALDDAIYSVAHPSSPDATPGATRHDVLKAIKNIAASWPIYRDIANKIADDYAKEHNLT